MSKNKKNKKGSVIPPCFNVFNWLEDKNNIAIMYYKQVGCIYFVKCSHFYVIGMCCNSCTVQTSMTLCTLSQCNIYSTLKVVRCFRLVM